MLNSNKKNLCFFTLLSFLFLLYSQGLVAVERIEGGEYFHERRPFLTEKVQKELLGMPSLKGEKITEETFRNKVVIINFFASWCVPCRAEFKHLKEVYRIYRSKGVEIIGVNLYEDFDDLSDEKRLEAFLRTTDPNFPVIKGNIMLSHTFGKVERIPTLFVYDRKGRHVFKFINKRGAKKTSLDISELKNVISGL